MKARWVECLAARLGTYVLQTGVHPAVLKDQATTPGGCAIAGLSKMEEGRVRHALASGVEEAARAASKLGQG